MNVEIAPQVITATVEQGGPIHVSIVETRVTADVQNDDRPGIGIDVAPIIAEMQMPAEIEADVSFAGGFTIGIGAPGGGTPPPVVPGSDFLDPPDLVDETGVSELVIGWADVGGSWLVRRQVRGTVDIVNATPANNPTIPDLATAWEGRATLVYA